MTHNGASTVSPSRLQDEIRQNVPFRSRTQEAFLSILRTSDLAKKRFDDLFEEHGITFQQYNVLRILRGAGEAGLPTLEIGARMIEQTPGVTRILDRLEGKGLVARERSANDRRQVWCRITPQGLALLESLDDPVDRTDETLFSGMDPEDVDDLIRILSELRDRLTGP